jgi:exonuclease III
MPFYKPVFDAFKDDPARAAAFAGRLLKLRHQFKKDGVPERNVTESILIATWNLREFGRAQKCGPRLDSSLLCIAEIVAHFDIVAIQEVNQNMRDLKRLRFLLGEWWDYIVTDVVPGRAGNQERIAFVFDSRKIRFDHLAGEVTLPSDRAGSRQLSRSPFLCAFRSGWRRTSLCSVHIYYGSDDPNDPTRVAEIDELSKLLDKRNMRRENESDGEPENIILLGDFNIFNRTGDKTSKALSKNNFVIPKAIQEIPAGGNLARDKYYDQIAFHDPRGQLKATANAGVFEFTRSIFGADDADAYYQDMMESAPLQYQKAKDKVKFYRQWRTFQLSDHYPLWVEIKTNFSDAFLGSQLKRSHEVNSK